MCIFFRRIMKRTTKIVLLDIIIIIASVLFIFIFTNYRLPPCFVKDMVGLDCPACGGTRMVINIFRLNFIKALLYNPYMFFLFIYGVLFFLLLNISIINKKAIQIIKKLYCLKMCYLWCAGLIIFAVIRNLKFL